jgi:hypothetical protein
MRPGDRQAGSRRKRLSAWPVSAIHRPSDGSEMENLLTYIPVTLYVLAFAIVGAMLAKLAHSKTLSLFIGVLTVILAFTLLALMRSRAPLNAQVAIDTPKQQSAYYAPPVAVQGTVFPASATVHLLVHPEDTDSWWVQSAPEQDKVTGRWRSTCYIGTDSMGIGRRYDIVAVGSASPWFLDALWGRILVPGTTVKILPLISKSEIVVVTRME